MPRFSLSQLSASKFFTLMVVIMLVLVNFLSLFFFLRFDWTRSGAYSLSASTKNILSALDDTLTVKAYFTQDLPPQMLPLKNYVSDILLEYQAFGGKNVVFEFVDPAKDAAAETEAQQLGIQTVRMQVRAQDSFQVKDGYLGIGLFYKEKKFAIPVVESADLAGLEYALSSLILKMTLDRLPVIGLLKGHGEHEVGFSVPLGLPENRFDYSIVGEALRKQYTVRTIDISAGDSLEGVDVLVIAGPRRDFSPRDLFELDQFFLEGKKGIFLLDGTTQNERSIEQSVLITNALTAFSSWGVSVKPQILLDRNADFGQFSEGPGRFFILPYPPFIRFTKENFSDHPAVAKIPSFVGRFMNPLEIVEKEGLAVKPFMMTGKQAWTQDAPFQLNPTSLPDPSADVIKQYPVAVEVFGMLNRISDAKSVPPLLKWVENQKKEWKLETVGNDPQKSRRKIFEKAESPSRVMFFPDSDFLSNGNVSQDSTGLLLFLNMVDSLALGDGLISIRSKSLDDAPIRVLANTEKTVMKVLGIVLVPILLSGFGVVRLWMRRKE